MRRRILGCKVVCLGIKTKIYKILYTLVYFTFFDETYSEIWRLKNVNIYNTMFIKIKIKMGVHN